jgi:Tol biopolymer transport system component
MRGALSNVIKIVFAFPFLLLAAFAATPPSRMQAVAISPDGKLVAVTYISGDTSFIYKIALDTGKAVRLTDAKAGEESSPAFSPDGKRIAYVYWPRKEAHSQIIIVNVDGSDPHSWSPSDVDDLRPVFSPDNKTIVFSRSGFFGSYSPIAQPHAHDWSFYASDLDGTNARQITHESFYSASSADVSPDGKNMILVAETADSPGQIAVYSLDHPGKQLLSLRPHVPNEADHKNPIFNCPNFMPDGKSILFMAASNGKHGFDYDVYEMEIETGKIEGLTTGNGYATDLKVSADGKTAVLLKWHSDAHATPVTNELFLLDMQSRDLTPVAVTGLN